MMKKAVVLCSGGIDSVVCAHYIKKILKYPSINILFFNYGQRTLRAERECAKQCAHDIGAEFHEISLPLSYLKAPLVRKNREVRPDNQLKNTKREHKSWYVPGRNTLFLSHAFSFAETLMAKEGVDIFVGFKCEGREPYPDTTEAYVEKMNSLLKTAFKEIKLHAILIKKDKEDIILLGKNLNVDFRRTISCYTSSPHCGKCLACRLRKQGFYWANVQDPTSYVP